MLSKYFRVCLFLCFLAPSILFLLHASAFAGAVPKQLYNKTITIVWQESIVERSLDGRIHTPQNTQQRIVYVSNLGRIFDRRKTENRSGVKLVEIAPENARDGASSFRGNSMTSTGLNGGVARRVVASFDPSYSNCTATVIAGKSSAAPEWKGMNGETFVVEDIKVGTVSCTVAAGNDL